ncbi:MAG TPA: hypothetical protein ENI73_03450, partial [Spirochaetes bacterium]|nr:hypothetical protein [Spirochaetota bacterium]
MSFFHSNIYKKTVLPLIIAFAAFIFTVIISELEFVRNFEYQITDTAKFRGKNYIEKANNEVVDSEIMILGVNEKSGTDYLNDLFGPYPWPRDVYAEYLSYFNLDLPLRFKPERIASILDRLGSDDKQNKIKAFIETNYVQRDQIFEKVINKNKLDSQSKSLIEKVYNNIMSNLKKDYREMILKKELREDAAKRAVKAQEWFRLVYDMDLNEIKALTWNSI